MPLMNWDEIMSVGVEEIDDQHRRLIDLINEAYEALQKHDEHRMSELIDKMSEYAQSHFESEERYLARCDFPHLEAHKVQHVQFNQTVAEFRRQQFSETNLSKIFVFLSRWLATHILESDKEYAPYLSEAGKKPA